MNAIYPNVINKHGSLHAALMVVCVAGGVLSACTNEVDDYFDKPASQRLAATIDKAKQVLRSAEYGWEFEYYPGSDLAYGGMVYTVKFDDLDATVGCSLIEDSTETSLYKLTNDNGPVLSFDTYNSLMHYFATPSSSEYEAKGGEFEFVIDSIADDFISLYGKKAKNSMSMRKLKASPDEYAKKTIDIFDHFVDSIKGNIGTAAILAKCDPTSRSMHMTAGSDTMDIHFAFTDQGIRFYKPVTIGGVSVQSFSFDTETNVLSCTDPGNEGISLQGIPYAATFMNYAKYEGDYTLTYGTNSSIDVHLKPNRLEGTYLMQGLSPKFDLVVRYDPESGDLRLGAQTIGEIDGLSVYWSTVNYSSTGSVSNIGITDEGQFTLKWNGNRFYPRFNFSATNPNLYNVNSALLIYLYYNDSGNLSAAIVNDPDWFINGSYLMANLKTLNRKGRLE